MKLISLLALVASTQAVVLKNRYDVYNFVEATSGDTPIAPVKIPMGDGCEDIYDLSHSVQTIFGPGYECRNKKEGNYNPGPNMNQLFGLKS